MVIKQLKLPILILWQNKELFEPVLYDTINDQYEMNNLYFNEDYKDIRNQMEKMLKDWIKKTEDPFDTGERQETTNMLNLNQEFASPESSYQAQ